MALYHRYGPEIFAIKLTTDRSQSFQVTFTKPQAPGSGNDGMFQTVAVLSTYHWQVNSPISFGITVRGSGRIAKTLFFSTSR